MKNHPARLIAKKRDGGELANDEIRDLVSGVVDGSLGDAQLGAFLMAVCCNGMTPVETAALTIAMRDSGRVLKHDTVARPKIDKHSTGGVGDKVSLLLAPLVAAAGVAVPMVSGRGLGHTGGTIDKLAALPGYRTDLSLERFQGIVAQCGFAMMAPSADLAPADRRMYATRDISGTVESIPLITSSILSKKLAEGIDALVLDVKVGRGAFMKTRDDARALATALVRVGTAAGKRVNALLTDMDAPLGRAIGNANETREAIDVLHGRGPADLVECTLALGSEMLQLGKVATTDADARAALLAAIRSGRAARVMERMIEAQGGDPSVVAHPEKLADAAVVTEITAPSDGFVTRADALELGLSAVALGAGRTRADQAVDPAVGIELVASRGARVARGDVLARIFSRSADAGAKIRERVAGAFSFGEAAPPAAPLVLERITA